jgi:hypothetical protein
MKTLRSKSRLLAVILVVGASGLLWGPPLLQWIHLCQVEAYLKNIQPAWTAFQNQHEGFAGIRLLPYTNSGGLLGVWGVVPTEGDLERLNRFLKETKPPRPIHSDVAAMFQGDYLEGQNLDSLGVAELVERLVSPVGPPPPEITDYMGGTNDMKKWLRSMTALFEGYEHPQVRRARAKLVSRGTSVFPELIKHLEDKRYSCSSCSAAWGNSTVGDVVGEVMAEVVGGRFHPWGYKWWENAQKSNGQPSFGQMMSERGKERYAEHAKSMTRDEVEKEYVRWYMEKEKSYGFQNAQQEEDILAPCLKRLSEL